MLAAVVLDALGAPPDPELDRAVGPGAAQRLRRELRDVARRWAAALAPGHAFEATSGAAAAIALDGHEGPVVLVAPDIPALGPAHARSVLDDLEAGTASGSGRRMTDARISSSWRRSTPTCSRASRRAGRR